MPRRGASFVLAVCFSGAASLPAEAAGEGQEPTRLRLDVDRHVAEALAPQQRAGVPRFEVEVVERWPQTSLEGHLRGADLECQPSREGPPSTSEMRRHMGASIPVHADFVGPLKALVRLFRGKGSPRYFLYLIHAEDRTVYALREGPASETVRSGTPGVTWELVGSFAELRGGQAALRRLERGFERAERNTDDERLPPWVDTTCRPPGLD